MPAFLSTGLGRGALSAAKRSGPTFPLSVHSSGRYLIDAQGSPFPIFGDSAWWAAFNLSVTDQNTYLADRLAKGFNSTLLTSIEHNGTLNKPPLDFVSNLPFTNQLGGSTYTGSPNGTLAAAGNSGQWAADNYTSASTQCPNFTTPNAAYWTRLKQFVKLCGDYGQVVFMFSAYVGFAGGDQGWMVELLNNDANTGAGGLTGQPYANAGKSFAWNYGAYLASFFSDTPNIIWIQGGDYGSGSTSGTFTTGQKTAVDNLMLGMKSVSGQLSQLHTAHWSRVSLATDVTLTSSFDVESIYASTFPSQTMRTGWAQGKPTFQIEGEYDGDGSGVSPFRQYLWATYLSGGQGFFGDDSPTPGPIWEFKTTGATWTSLLNTAGMQDMSRLFGFMRARPWHRLVPNALSGIGTIITANGGTIGTTNYIAACADPLGACLIAYVPPAWALTTFTVDLSTISSGGTKAICRWFDPSNAAYSLAGTFATTGTQVFTPPGTTSDGKTDWILLCETTP